MIRRIYESRSPLTWPCRRSVGSIQSSLSASGTGSAGAAMNSAVSTEARRVGHFY